MKRKSKTTAYIVHSIAAAVLVLTAQISLAGSATWLSSPQDSAWENANNWTAGGPPNGPSDTATFAQSSHRDVNISTSEKVNSIVFTSDSFSFLIAPGDGQLIISGEGINNNNISQFFDAGGQMIFNHTSTAGSATITNESLGPGQTIFNDTSTAANASIVNTAGDFDPRSGQTTFNGASTADHASIANEGGFGSHATSGGQTTFNGTSTAANASIHNVGTTNSGTGGQTVFNDTSTAAQATITNDGDFFAGGTTIFNDSSTADSAIITANGTDEGGGGAILFNGASTGGTARVRVFDNGYLDISGHRSGVTIGSIEGSGNVFLGANNLRVGTNGINTSFSGVISNDGQGGSLTKVGTGVLTLQTNDCIADTVGLILVSGSIIKLDFTGSPDTIASLVVNGVPQPPGVYGSATSGAPHPLPEFAGPGTVRVASPFRSQLGNISTRAFVETGDNVLIGGFIVQGSQPKRVIIRAIGPELTQYGVPDALVNPTLELHDGTGALIASNNNWRTTIIGGIITSDQVREIRSSGYAPGDARESAIISDLPAGNYTAILRGLNNLTGVALVEVYDLGPGIGSILGNISSRAFVETGDNVMIGGFIVQGAQPKRVIVRAIGPELSTPPYNVPNALANPTLELHDGTGALIASNDNWPHTIIGGIITSNQFREIRDSGHAPGDGRESAIIADLPPGNYTAIVRGVNNTTGVALVEVSDLEVAFDLLATVPLPTNSQNGVAVNAALNKIYASGGASAGQRVVVIDATTFAATDVGAGSNVSVDPNTNRYWAANVYGGAALVRDGTNHLLARIHLGFCPIDTTYDSNRNRVWVGAQCGDFNDPVFAIDAATFNVVAGPIGSGGVMGPVIANGATGRLYLTASGVSKRVDPTTFAVITNAFGQVMAVNGVTNRLYATDGNNLQIINGATNPETILKTVALSYSPASMGINTALNHLYLANSAGSSIEVRNGGTGALIATFSLGPFGATPNGAMAVDSTRGRIYVIASSTSGPVLLVIQDLTTG